MKCRICETETDGKARFESYLADGRHRGPFCVHCTHEALRQMEHMELGTHEIYMRHMLGYTATEPYPCDIEAVLPT